MTELPEGLLAALDVYESDPDFMPPQGSPGMRAMARLDGTPTKADFEWVERQEVLHEQAAVLWNAITQIAPMPTSDDVVNGDAFVYPDWVGTIWAETMQQPWSQDLDAAVAEAEAYLAEKQEAAAEA